MGDEQDKLAQPQLVPVEALFCGPVKTGTADASDGCFCPNGAAYIIKKIKDDNPHSPHNEWFCANLATKVGVSVAPFNIVKHVDGNEWFGSQYRVGEIQDWWLRVLEGVIDFDDLREDLCRIYAFDLFVNNIDRHNKNFMVVSSGDGHRALAIDHGRAWLFSGFPPPVSFMPPCNTTAAFAWMKQNFPDYPVKKPMVEMLEAIREIKVAVIVDILERQPDKWLETSIKDGIVAWWENGAAVDRATSLINGVANGSAL